MTAGSADGLSIEARTGSADDTRALAASLAPVLSPGDVLLLVGDLGAGKTTFAQGLARGLGVTEQVTSPTFTLVRPYACATATAGDHDHIRGNGRPPVQTMLHADLYRMDRLREVADLALGEMVEDGAVAVVEWGDVGAPVLGPAALVARIAEPHDDVDARLVTIEVPPDRAELAGPLRAALARWARPAEG